MDELISRAQAIAAIEGTDWYTQNKNKDMVQGAHGRDDAWYKATDVYKALEELPSAQPEPLSDAYMNAVWAWLIDYQIKVAELKGRYTPYEVLSWVANDWRRDHADK